MKERGELREIIKRERRGMQSNGARKERV